MTETMERADAPFAGKTALVTGGSSGIGRETAIEFGRRGASVVVASRRPEESEETVSRIEALDGEATFVRTDVTREDDVEHLVKRTIEAYGGLDFAFNNAGNVGRPGPLTELTEDDWDYTSEANLKGVWFSLKHEIPAMIERGGAIVNTASDFGHVGAPNFGAYVAAKHGVVGLTRTAAVEYADEGVRVNAVSPGVVLTSMTEDVFGSAAAVEETGSTHPLGRVGTPEDIAAAVMWLCSDDASFVTGHPLRVDGGKSAQ